VPLSVKIVTGDVLSVTVASFIEGRYRLPIIVDPIADDPIWENGLYNSTYHKTEWKFVPEGRAFSAPEHPEGGKWYETIGSHNSTEWSGLFYTTRGESQIMSAGIEGRWNDSGSGITNYMVLYAPARFEGGKEVEGTHTESYNYLLPSSSEYRYGEAGEAVAGDVCAPPSTCEGTVDVGSPGNNNTVAYQQDSYQSGSGGWNEVVNAFVDISL
jgi:hypothetical protein